MLLAEYLTEHWPSMLCIAGADMIQQWDTFSHASFGNFPYNPEHGHYCSAGRPLLERERRRRRAEETTRRVGDIVSTERFATMVNDIQQQFLKDLKNFITGMHAYSCSAIIVHVRV
jgi:hypothetical protein